MEIIEIVWEWIKEFKYVLLLYTVILTATYFLGRHENKTNNRKEE